MPFPTIDTKADLQAGIEFVCECEPAFKRVFEATGLPPLRRRENDLGGLIEIITGQLISLKAAAAIWQRLESKLAPFDEEILTNIDDSVFAECGLSKPKIRTIRAVLTEITNGKLSLTKLETAENSEIFTIPTAIKDIGPWTAQIYLLTNLGRRDVWPAGDLALQESAKLLFNLENRPNEREMREIAEPWQPWRAAAARLLWSHYRLVRLEGGAL